MLPSISRLTVVLAALALVAAAVAVPAAFPGRLGYGCGGPQGADLDRTDRGHWLVLRGGESVDANSPVVARYANDWRELARYELDVPPNASADARVVALVPSSADDGFWLVTSDGRSSTGEGHPPSDDDRAHRYARDGSFTGETTRAGDVLAGNDPSLDAAPEHAIDWEDERYGDAVDAELGADRNYVLARDGTVLEYATNWQFTGVTHQAVEGSECLGERPAWPSAWELLIASTAVGLVGLALTSALARDDLGLAAALAVGGPVLAGTFSTYGLPEFATAVYHLPDVAIGLGLLAPVAVAGWYHDEDPVVSLPLLALSASALVAAGVRYLLASAVL
jgi:hypothetical protein